MPSRVQAGCRVLFPSSPLLPTGRLGDALQGARCSPCLGPLGPPILPRGSPRPCAPRCPPPGPGDPYTAVISDPSGLPAVWLHLQLGPTPVHVPAQRYAVTARAAPGDVMLGGPARAPLAARTCLPWLAAARACPWLL
eukprot:gene4815-biopygen791